MPLETVERGVKGTVRERGEPGHAQVDADRAAARQVLLNLSLCLDAHKPLATPENDGDVLHRAEHLAAVAVAQPTELGQEQARVHLVEPDLLRVRITEAVVLSLLLETRQVGPPGEEVSVSAFQILERLFSGCVGASFSQDVCVSLRHWVSSLHSSA